MTRFWAVLASRYTENPLASALLRSIFLARDGKVGRAPFTSGVGVARISDTADWQEALQWGSPKTPKILKIFGVLGAKKFWRPKSKFWQ